MINIHIIAVGKLNNIYLPIFQHYSKMLKWPLKITDLNYHKKLSTKEAISYEAELIGANLQQKSYKIALDLSGDIFTSTGFCELLNKVSAINSNIQFIIGGAYGLDSILLQKVDKKLCLSNMTLPHQLAKIVLIEQLYRAQTISSGHPYHK